MIKSSLFNRLFACIVTAWVCMIFPLNLILPPRLLVFGDKAGHQSAKFKYNDEILKYLKSFDNINDIDVNQLINKVR